MPVDQDPAYFLELQTRTGWGQTLASFASWCAPQPGWRVLDIGCGPGLLPALFSGYGCQAWGIDLDMAMFQPAPLYPQVALASVYALPFADQSFDLLTASNLLFLLAEPRQALAEMSRVLRGEQDHPRSGQLCLLNPSEKISVAAARTLAEARGLTGLAYESLLNWAGRAEAHARWDDAQLSALLADAGLQLQRSELRIGPGLARLACALRV